MPSIAACHVFSLSFLLYAQRLIVNRSAIIQPIKLEKLIKSHISTDYVIQFMLPTFIINNKLLVHIQHKYIEVLNTWKSFMGKILYDNSYR